MKCIPHKNAACIVRVNKESWTLENGLQHSMDNVVCSAASWVCKHYNLVTSPCIRVTLKRMSHFYLGHVGRCMPPPPTWGTTSGVDSSLPTAGGSVTGWPLAHGCCCHSDLSVTHNFLCLAAFLTCHVPRFAGTLAVEVCAADTGLRRYGHRSVLAAPGLVLTTGGFGDHGGRHCRLTALHALIKHEDAWRSVNVDLAKPGDAWGELWVVDQPGGLSPPPSSW